jgi:hypothetical protein
VSLPEGTACATGQSYLATLELPLEPLGIRGSASADEPLGPTVSTSGFSFVVILKLLG